MRNVRMAENSPKISLIVPCYGVEKYLDRCMESLLCQTLQDIEIILVDDGSPDRVPKMCDEYAEKDNRIKVIHKKNEGLGYARNSGLEIATGEYVAFIDSDDYIDADVCQRLYDEALKNKSDAVFYGFNIETSKGRWQKSQEVEKNVCWTDKDITSFMLDMIASASEVSQERKYYMSVWHAIYRKSIIEDNNILFLSERDVASEDIPFQVDFLKCAKRVSYLNFNGYYYCLNGNSLTATFKREKYERFKLLRSILKKKLAEYPEADSRADRFLIGYTRTQLHHLMSSKTPHKIQEIKTILKDPIWQELKSSYPASNFTRPDLRIMYKLILGRHAHLLYINSKLINLLRHILS